MPGAADMKSSQCVLDNVAAMDRLGQSGVHSCSGFRVSLDLASSVIPGSEIEVHEWPMLT